MGGSTEPRRRTRGYGGGLGIFLFLVVPLGGYALLNVYPSLLSIYYSLTKYSGYGQPEFIGLRNFANMLQDKTLGIALVNGVRNLLLVVGLQVPFGLILAFLLSRVRRGSKALVFFYFLPIIVAEALLALMWKYIYNSEWGLLNSSLRAVGLDTLVRKWLSNPKLAPWTVLVPGAWQWVGFNVVLFLAAIEDLPQEVLEAATIDGANGWQRLYLITLPMLRNVYVMATILAINGSLAGGLGYPLVLTNGGPFRRSTTLGLYIYNLLSPRWGGVAHWGYAAAVVALNFALASALSGITWLFRRGGEID